jgi:dTDP-4-dehydrorhamnose reductase
MVTRVKAMAGFPGQVRRQTAAELGLAAPRPAYSALTSVYLPQLGVEPMPPLEDSLKRFLDGLP